MHITFGLALDGATHPHALSHSDANLTQPVMGPEKLLTFLQTHCGLLSRPITPSLRIAIYAERLAAADRPTAFYHRSLARDRWGTARAVLQLRDSLVESGWTPRNRQETARLEDIARVEAVSAPDLPEGRADLIPLLLEALASTPLPIDAITHVEPLHLLPSVWQRILEASKIPLRENPSAVPIARNSDLAHLQRALQDPTYIPPPPSADGTVLRLHAPDPWQAAEALASWLASFKNRSAFTIVRGGNEQLLDQTFRRHGLPAPGYAPKSRWRPPLQILPLAFACVWKPLDPSRFLELLTHPVSPIPHRAAFNLARAFCKYPGTDNIHWQNAWADALQADFSEDIATDDADLAAERDLNTTAAVSARTRHRLERWLSPKSIACHHPDDGIPKGEAMGLAARVARWADSRARHESDSAFEAAIHQAWELYSILDLWSAPTPIPRTQIDQMIDQVSATGSVASPLPPEVGHIPCVDEPAALFGDTDVTIWWNFVDVPRGDAPLTQAWQWRQPLLRARRALVLVMPDSLHHHPLYDEIRARFCRSRAAEEKITMTISALLRGTGTQRFPIIKFPPAKPVWHPTAEIRAPAAESASSIESLLACPLQWTLQYVLNLRDGGQLSTDNRLSGQLAHDVLEELLPPGPIRMDPQEAANRAASIFDRRVAGQATPLLAADRTSDRIAVRQRISVAAGALFRILNEKSMDVVGTELTRETSLENHRLGGRLDVLLTYDGKPYVLDLKYTRSRHLRARSIQLATYGHLTGTSRTAYFSISDARLIEHEEKFEAILEARSARLEQIRNRKVAVTGCADRDPLALGLDPPCTLCDFRPICRVGAAFDAD